MGYLSGGRRSTDAGRVAPTLRRNPASRVVVPVVLTLGECTQAGFDVIPPTPSVELLALRFRKTHEPTHGHKIIGRRSRSLRSVSHLLGPTEHLRGPGGNHPRADFDSQPLGIVPV